MPVLTRGLNDKNEEAGRSDGHELVGLIPAQIRNGRFRVYGLSVGSET